MLRQGGGFLPSKEPTKMTTIKIDDKDYDLEFLSDEAKNQLVSLQFDATP